MKRIKYILLVLLIFNVRCNAFAIDTLYIQGQKHIENINVYLTYFEDSTNTLDSHSVLSDDSIVVFTDKFDHKLNFGFSTTTHWFKIIITGNTDKLSSYVLDIRNPDLDYVNFFEVKGDNINKVFYTGELRDVSSRDIYARNFSFNLNIGVGETNTYYLQIFNDGHPCIIPLELKSSSQFHFDEYLNELFSWLIYGILFFIIGFNIYLYITTRDKVNLYYSLYVLFATLVLISYDGYFFLLGIAKNFENFKWINGSLYIVFLLSFTQAFLKDSGSLLNLRKSLNIFKIVAILFLFFYMLDYPLSMLADIGIPLLILMTLLFLIGVMAKNLDRSYPPSYLLFISYCLVFSGVFIHELKEADVFSTNLLIDNSIRIGLTLECILITVAVLERFRINQNKTKHTILSNYKRIEYQNKELEFINTELEKLSLVASETNNSIAIFDTYGILEWCNLGFEHFYDTTQKDLMEAKRDNIKSIIPDASIEKYVNLCVEKKQHSIFETLTKTVRQKEIWLQITLSPFIKNDKTQKLIAIGSDITELKKYEKKLTTALEKAEESDQLKSSFLANMSHEVRTPLNGIIGFSNLLAMPGISDEKKDKYVQTIQTNGHRLIHIIEDIVEISLIESRQLKLIPNKFSLKGTIKESIVFFETLKKTIEKEHITITSKLNHGSEFDILFTDQFRITQVLNNLLRNAFKFSHKGKINLRSERKDKFIEICIEDEGIGVEEEMRDKIFELFRQKEVTIAREYGGSGLGLSISKGIVELLGGKIWLDINYKKGARFCFTLPLSLVVEKTEAT